MKYRFVDEIVSLDLGEAPRIEVRKTFAAGDDALSGPAGPRRVPNSLILELMAMAGGHLIFRHLDASRLPLLLKVHECRFEGRVGPDVPLRAVAELAGISAASELAQTAEARSEVFAGEARIASGRLLYLCVSVPGVKLAGLEEGR